VELYCVKRKITLRSAGRLLLFLCFLVRQVNVEGNNKVNKLKGTFACLWVG